MTHGSVILALARARAWQPPPHVAAAKDGPLSWWFYRRVVPESGLWQRSRVGEWWFAGWSLAIVFARRWRVLRDFARRLVEAADRAEVPWRCPCCGGETEARALARAPWPDEPGRRCTGGCLYRQSETDTLVCWQARTWWHRDGILNGPVGGATWACDLHRQRKPS